MGRAFLLGIPVIGPQVAVYKSLCAQLAARSAECWSAWGPVKRRLDLAQFMGREFGRACGWPNPVFIPDDPFRLVCWSHEAVVLDDLDVDEVFITTERHLGIGAEAAAWEQVADQSFGEVVDHLLGKVASQGV